MSAPPEYDAEKASTHHVDNDKYDEHDAAAAGFAEAENAPPTGFKRFLRRNPSMDFMREVAAECEKDDLDPEEVKRVEKKLYLLIVPALAVCYLFYYVDKTTLAYAALFGIKEDLNLQGTDYSNLGSIFYVGWIIWAIPGNLLLAKFPLSKYLAANIFLWGVFLMAQAGSKTYGAMLGLRFVSGMFEAVADPCFVAITSMYFTRRQQPLVIGYWYAANGVGIALGGLFGYGIGQIEGALAPWRYEFLIIGAACSLWAFAMAFLIPDAPHRGWPWFSRREAVVILARKRFDHHTIERRQFKLEQVKESLKDPKTYLFWCIGFFANVPNGATSNFGTLVVKGLGFNQIQTTLLQIPYGAFITLVIFLAIGANHWLHAYNVRTYLMFGVTLLTVVGFAMMSFTKSTASRLAGYYLTGSSNAVFVLALSLVAGNVGGTTKKTLASAAIFVGMSLGNIVGPYSFLSSEAPTYHTGTIVCMVSRAAEAVAILLLRLCFTIPNRRRDAAFAAGDADCDPNVQIFEDISDERNKHFRYVA